MEIWVREEDAHIDTVLVESGGSRTPVIFSSDEETDPAPLPIVIHGDGSYSNTAGTVVTSEDIYEHAIRPYQEIAQRYGVGFMIGEFGVFAGADWDIGVVAAYQDTMMEAFAQYGLGWCYCELTTAAHTCCCGRRPSPSGPTPRWSMRASIRRWPLPGSQRDARELPHIHNGLILRWSA